MIVLHVLCLMSLLTGCGSTRTVYVQVPTMPLPANLLAETPQPVIPNPLTYGDSLSLNVVCYQHWGYVTVISLIFVG
ncbi:Rz1-like lysis system protein LysC [Salmonella enterica]|uniref:Rz1-like lysis system protein LysC n=1 Tax=Salmonella enterica TaxID=28901 RepID=UPI003F9ED8E5